MHLIGFEHEKEVPPIGKKRLHKLIYRDGLFCHYCGCRCEISHDNIQRENTATVDHIIPKAIGGLDKIDNCVLACYKCNNSKGRKINYSVKYD